MTNQNGRFYVDGNVVAQENSQFMTRVYQWMTIGVLITSLIAAAIGNNSELINIVMSNQIIFWGIIIAQLGILFSISGFISKMSVSTATMLFLVYSALTGISFSVLFMIYARTSIQSAFFTTTIGFAGLTIFGHVTKKDLSAVGSFCMMGLFGLVGYSLLAIFFPSMMGGTAGLVISMIGLLVFAGLTAYDTQKIKLMGRQAVSEEERGKIAVLGALTLYLDFINLFMMILRLTGDRRR